MRLRRLITDLMGRTIPEKVVRRLGSSPRGEIEYRGGRLFKIREWGILWTGLNGYERLYDDVGSRLILEYFRWFNNLKFN